MVLLARRGNRGGVQGAWPEQKHCAKMDGLGCRRELPVANAAARSESMERVRSVRAREDSRFLASSGPDSSDVFSLDVAELARVGIDGAVVAAAVAAAQATGSWRGCARISASRAEEEPKLWNQGAPAAARPTFTVGSLSSSSSAGVYHSLKPPDSIAHAHTARGKLCGGAATVESAGAACSVVASRCTHSASLVAATHAAICLQAKAAQWLLSDEAACSLSQQVEAACYLSATRSMCVRSGYKWKAEFERRCSQIGRDAVQYERDLLADVPPSVRVSVARGTAHAAQHVRGMAPDLCMRLLAALTPPASARVRRVRHAALTRVPLRAHAVSRPDLRRDSPRRDLAPVRGATLTPRGSRAVLRSARPRRAQIARAADRVRGGSHAWPVGALVRRWRQQGGAPISYGPAQ